MSLENAKRIHEKSKHTFEIKEIKNELITPRCKHISFYNSKNKKLYIYGGFGVDSFTKNIKVLNDFYTYDTMNQIFEKISYKGGENMKGKLYNCVYIKTLEKYFFISGEDLSTFFFFDPASQIFTQNKINFDIPTKRNYFTITNLVNDNRVLLLGGSFKEYCYCDCYVLTDLPDFDLIDPKIEINYETIQTIKSLPINYQWNRYDITGRCKEGYSGHQTIALENNSFFICGGTENAFDGLNPQGIKLRPRINEKFQILSLESNYFWYNLNLNNDVLIKDKKEKNDSKERFFNYENIQNPKEVFGDKKSEDSLSKKPEPTSQHIMVYINKDLCGEKFSKFLIHGGRTSEGIITNQSFFYQFDSSNIGEWIKLDSGLELTSHSCCIFFPFKNSTTYYIIMTGGIGIFTSYNEIIEDTKKTEIISGDVYYLNEFHKFDKIPLKTDTNKNTSSNNKGGSGFYQESSETLKRYGHSMVELYLDENNGTNKTSKGYLFIVGGYQLYEGFPTSVAILDINIDISDHTKDKKKMTYSYQVVDIGEFGFRGRVFPSCSVAFNKLVVYGGVCEEEILDDMFIISFEMKQTIVPSVQKIVFNQNLLKQGIHVLNINGRFGASMVFQPDSEKTDNKGKLFVFGGRFSLGDSKKPKNITNQVVIFNLKNKEETIDVESSIPTIYGFTEKRNKHTACIRDNQMYVWGGRDYFLKMEIPLESFDIDETLVDYLNNNRQLGYFDWEEGLEKRQDKQWRSKIPKEQQKKIEELYMKGNKTII